MSIDIYPSGVRGLTYTILRTAEFSTMIQAAGSFYENRLPQTYNPRWHWSFIYEYLKDFDVQGGFTQTDFRTLLGFYLSHGGQSIDFLFQDPDDNFVGPALISGTPNPLAQLQLWNDGAGNYYSPIQRNMGGFLEDITDLNPAVTPPYSGTGVIAVYANSVAQLVGPRGGGNNCGVYGPGLGLVGNSAMGLYLKWYAPPTPPINVTFNYYFRVRFEEDTNDFEKFMNQYWTVGGQGSKNGKGYIKLCSSRPVSI